MQVEFVGNKAKMASEKHFGGKLNDKQMKQLVIKVFNNRTHIGVSDRANGGHGKAYIVWGDYAGVKFGMIIDSKDVKKNKLTVVSFYDVHNIEHKIARFNMKEV